MMAVSSLALGLKLLILLHKHRIGRHCLHEFTLLTLDSFFKAVEICLELSHLRVLQMYPCLQLSSFLLHMSDAPQELPLVLSCHPLRVLDSEIYWSRKVSSLLIECITCTNILLYNNVTFKLIRLLALSTSIAMALLLGSVLVRLAQFDDTIGHPNVFLLW